MLIKELIYSIIKRWRVLLVVTLVMGICGAAVYTVGYLTADQSSVSEVNQTTEAFENWQNAEDFYIASLNYTVFGSEDHLGQAARDAYILHMSGSSFKMKLAESLFSDHDSLNYISSIFHVGVGATSSGLSVQLLHYDEELCGQFAEFMVEYIKTYGETITSSVGSHRIVLVDSDLVKGYGTSFDQWLEQVQATLSADEKEVEDFVGFSKKKIVVYAFLFAAVSDFLLVVWFLLSDTLKDRVYSFRQLSAEGEAKLLGDLSYVDLKGKLDQLLYRLLIGSRYFSLDGDIKLISHRLVPDERYVFTGIVSEEELNRVKGLFEQASANGTKLDARPILNKNADEIAAWSADEQVILVVKRFEDSGRSIRHWMNVYAGLNVRIAGILFI